MDFLKQVSLAELWFHILPKPNVKEIKPRIHPGKKSIEKSFLHRTGAPITPLEIMSMK